MSNIIVEAMYKEKDSLLALINLDGEFKELEFVNEKEIETIIKFISPNSKFINRKMEFYDGEEYQEYYNNIVNEIKRNEILKQEFEKVCEYVKENGKELGFSYTLDDIEFLDWGKDKEGKYPKTLMFPEHIRLDLYEDENLTHNKTNEKIFEVFEKYLNLFQEMEINKEVSRDLI